MKIAGQIISRESWPPLAMEAMPLRRHDPQLCRFGASRIIWTLFDTFCTWMVNWKYNFT